MLELAADGAADLEGLAAWAPVALAHPTSNRYLYIVHRHRRLARSFLSHPF